MKFVISKNRKIFTEESKRAFTLVEVILASSIFAVVGLIAVTVFVNVIRIQQRVNLENAIYEDARFMMERIAREIRRDTVDYEEYYNKLVEQQPYGTEYGCYGTRFYNPGSENPPNFGAFCNDEITPANPSCVIDKSTLDINTGENPYEGNKFNVPLNPKSADAFCDVSYAAASSCGDANEGLQHELYLIDSKGAQKTIFALKNISGTSDRVLAMLRLDGEDYDKDGIIEKWTQCSKNFFCCASGFNCPNSLAQVMPSGPEGPLESTRVSNGTDNYIGFVPISPSRTNIESVSFYIAPLEDPRKAFAEDSPDIQQQPHVTVILTVKPAQSVLKNYNGVVPTITLQTTITSRIYNEVKSYYGKGVCAQTHYL